MRWFFFLGSLLLTACGSEKESDSGTVSPPAAVDSDARIRLFCGVCHAFPEPSILPRYAWPEEIEKMYELTGADSRAITGIPTKKATLRYYRERAPATIPFPETYLDRPPGPLAFTSRGVPGKQPGVATITHDVVGKRLLVSDMRSGEVFEYALPSGPRRVLATFSHPARVEPVDLDGDGRRDLLVSELGSFLPADHSDGALVWLRGREDGTFDRIVLLDGVGRVADARAADWDGDGDLDIVVAVFGWRTTGKVLLLENNGKQKFRERLLDPTPGAINVPAVDINGDGHLDIVVVIAQGVESVIAFLGNGTGGFRRTVLWEAPHPDWGNSGIEICDLDADGDLDVVLVCGDTLDTGLLHAHQGVYWLRNGGTFPFSAQRLASHVGAHKVRAADLDGDGDLDLAASSFLPQLRHPDRDAPRLDSVIWIEQTATGRFTPHPIEADQYDHAALEVGDFDGDGDLDIVVGTLIAYRGDADALTFFWNGKKGK